jgi:predicted hydrocarbon binding protein
MERKAFLKTAVMCGAASSSLLLSKGGGMAQKGEHASSAEQKFKESWITTLMEHMEKQLDLKTRSHLMESCGRACAKRGAISIAKSCAGDALKLGDKLSEIDGVNVDPEDDGALHVTYDRCFCELVSHGPERLPEPYCECSRGWLVQMFETAAKKQVDVKIVQTIKRGQDNCQFIVRF